MQLHKILTVSIMVIVVVLGFSQLLKGAVLTCPVNACEDLVTCDIDIHFDCDNYCGKVGGERMYIYRVAKGSCGLITFCYGHYQWGALVSGAPDHCIANP